MTLNDKSIHRVLRKPFFLISYYCTVHNDAILLPKDNTSRRQTIKKRQTP